MAGMGLLSKAAVISVSHSKRKKHHLVVPTNLPSHSDTLIQYMLPFDMEAGRYSKHTQQIVVWETLLLSCSLEQTQGRAFAPVLLAGTGRNGMAGHEKEV